MFNFRKQKKSMSPPTQKAKDDIAIKKNHNKIKEDQEKLKKEYEVERNRLLSLYVPPHHKKSRQVIEKDISRVTEDGRDLLTLCSLPRGPYMGSEAMAHPQITDKDPLRFFMLPNGLIVINPLIVNHTKIAIFTEEGCMSYPNEPVKTMVPRYHKITVEFQTLVTDEKSKKTKIGPFMVEELSSHSSHVFQHEICHLNGYDIYQENLDPAWAVGFGDGVIVTPAIWGKIDKVDENLLEKDKE